MLRNFRLKMQSMILLVLIPSLLLVTLVISGLTYSGLHYVILEGFDRKLSAISTVMGAFIDGDEHAEILRSKNERDPRYLKYVRPMQRIRSPEKKDLTYVYTQVLDGGKSIRYVLDGQVKVEDHSGIGEEDEVPDNELQGVHDVIGKGRI